MGVGSAEVKGRGAGWAIKSKYYQAVGATRTVVLDDAKGFGAARAVEAEG